MKLLDKFWNYLGVNIEEEDSDEIFETKEYRNEEKETNRKNNVVALPRSKNFKVIICEPVDFDESQAIAENLIARKQVILNLGKIGKEGVAQRIIDFVSGTTYALNGTTQQLDKAMFLFTPANVEVVSTSSKGPEGYFEHHLNNNSSGK